MIAAIAGALVEPPPTVETSSPTAREKPAQTPEDLKICGEKVVRRKQLSGRYVHGVGIEIGAKHTPLPVDRRGNTRVIYVDHKDDDGLTAQFGDSPMGRPRITVDVVDDGATLARFSNRSLDFVIANHVLEHLPCALCALSNWARVLKPGGVVFAAIPNMRHTFDKDRDGPTPSAHHLAEVRDPPSAVRNVAAHARERNVKEAADSPGREMDAAQAAAFLASPAGPGLHIHTFTPESIHDLVHSAVDRAGLPLVQLAASRANPTECITILQRTAP